MVIPGSALPLHLISVMPLSRTPTPPYDPQTPTPRGRGLHREGAIANILSAAEQTLVDAMRQSSSPPPECVLGRRTRDDDDIGGPGANDAEDLDVTPRASALPNSNVSAMASRYASKKKLRPEQRDELDAFLAVSNLNLISITTEDDQDTTLGRKAKIFVNQLAIENKLDAIRSAAPAYQLSEELKVRAAQNNHQITNKFYRLTSITTALPSCFQSTSVLTREISLATMFWCVLLYFPLRGPLN